MIIKRFTTLAWQINDIHIFPITGLFAHLAPHSVPPPWLRDLWTPPPPIIWQVTTLVKVYYKRPTLSRFWLNMKISSRASFFYYIHREGTEVASVDADLTPFLELFLGGNVMSLLLHISWNGIFSFTDTIWVFPHMHLWIA